MSTKEQLNVIMWNHGYHGDKIAILEKAQNEVKIAFIKYGVVIAIENHDIKKGEKGDFFTAAYKNWMPEDYFLCDFGTVDNVVMEDFLRLS